MSFNPYDWYRSTLRNKSTRWLVIGFTLIYLFSPIDVIPDFILGLGFLDDGLIAAMLVSEIARLVQNGQWKTGNLKSKSDSESVIEVEAKRK